jgi:hypothetical protein
MIRRWAWPVVVVASSGLLFALVGTGSSSPIRTALTLWFFLVCPGMPYIQSLRIQDPLTRWTLAIALSVSIGTVVSLAILYAGVWSFMLGLIITTAIAWIGVGVLVARARAQQRLGQAEGV